MFVRVRMFVRLPPDIIIFLVDRVCILLVRELRIRLRRFQCGLCCSNYTVPNDDSSASIELLPDVNHWRRHSCQRRLIPAYEGSL